MTEQKLSFNHEMASRLNTFASALIDKIRLHILKLVTEAVHKPQNDKTGIAIKNHFVPLLISVLLLASCQSGSERDKTSYENLPNDSKIEIFALYQSIDLYSAKTANSNVLLDPTTITGKNESSKEQLKKHEDYQENLKSQLCEKVKNHYNISEATFQHIIADGEINNWGYSYRITESTLLEVVNKNFKNNWSYNSPTRTLEAQDLIDSTKIYMGQRYGGGIVVFILQPGDKGYDSSVPHGLIVAPQDQNLTSNENQRQEIPWATGDGHIDSLEKGSMKKTGASGTAVGTGLANTKAIISRFGEGNYAAWICHSLTLGGYKDWYLPSKDELFVLKVNQEQIGGFKDGAYWSSSESDNGNAWSTDLKHGNEQPYLKHKELNVRAVRSF